MTRLGSRNKNPTPAFSRGLSQRSRGFTLVELLVVIAIISVIAGFLIPTLIKSRGEADKVACKNNLREIVKVAILYADSGKRFFPYKRGGSAAHESLNEMVEFFSSGSDRLKPEMFICRSWRGDPAEPDEDGRFILDEDSCSYTWPDQKLAPTDSRALTSDKYVKSEDQLSGHELGMNVAFSDSSVKWVLRQDLDDDDLPKGLVR